MAERQAPEPGAAPELLHDGAAVVDEPIQRHGLEARGGPTSEQMAEAEANPEPGKRYYLDLGKGPVEVVPLGDPFRENGKPDGEALMAVRLADNPRAVTAVVELDSVFSKIDRPADDLASMFPVGPDGKPQAIKLSGNGETPLSQEQATRTNGNGVEAPSTEVPVEVVSPHADIIEAAEDAPQHEAMRSPRTGEAPQPRVVEVVEHPVFATEREEKPRKRCR